MTLTTWGLDSPRTLTEVTPCARDPLAWDVPYFSATSLPEALRAYAVALEAVRACYTCPLQPRCDRESRQLNVQHNCVYGGRVHYGGRWYRLADFHDYTTRSR